MRFVVVQSGIWSAYGIVLMLPWLGRYTISSMVPNKAFIAATAVMVSLLLRAVVRRTGSRFSIAIPSALAAGFLWNAAVVVSLGAPSEGLFSLGTLNQGVPLLGGSLYHGLLMLAWTLGYLATTRAVEPIPPAADSVTLRDGATTIRLRPAEITWIEADGDYVRLHGPAQRFLLRYTMKNILAELPSSFMRVHRSAIVNVDRIRELRPQPNRDFEIVLDDGSRTKASRTYSGLLADRFGRSHAR